MSLFEKIRGTSELLFQLGLGGPQVKSETVATVVGIAHRDLNDANYVPGRGADPIGDADFDTKHAVDHRFSRYFLLMGG